MHRWKQAPTSESFSPFKLLGTTPHAYGLLFDPYCTNVLIFDFDEPDSESISFVKNLLLEDKRVQVLDIAISSFNENGSVKGRHLYAGLDQVHNLISLYTLGIDGTCEGFNKLIAKKGDTVIRVSEKFEDGKPVPRTNIVWEEGYTRIGVDKWLKFTSEQLIAPLISADASSYDRIVRASSHVLRLRG